MKRYSIHLSIDNTDAYIVNYKKLLTLLSFDETTHYDVTIDATSLKYISYKHLADLILTEQEFGRAHKAIFKNMLNCSYELIDRQLLRTILRYGLEVIINIDGKFEENKKLTQIIHKLKKNNVPYYLNISCDIDDVEFNYNALRKTDYNFEIENSIKSTLNLINEFDKWCVQKENGFSFKTFEDILFRLLLGYSHRNCRYDSCLSKIISLSSNGNLYFCHINNELTFLKNISEVEQYLDIFEQQNFKEVLFKSLSKRKDCLNCSDFSICHSGCPLQYNNSINNCHERNYAELVHHIAEYLNKILIVGNILPCNPTIRRIVLVSIAYKGVIEINTINKGG